MKNKGFTLVELLTVIVILSLLIAIAVPSAIAISGKIKKKLLNSKITLAEQSAVLWAQDYKLCFTSDCTDNPLTCCAVDDNKMPCFITLDELAKYGYYDYDEDNRIVNPVDNTLSMNDYIFKITYNIKNKTFRAEHDSGDDAGECPPMPE